MKWILLFALMLTSASCINKQYHGIKIGNNLTDDDNYNKNQALCKLIDETFNGDIAGLNGLIRFQCGGGAGCYDLGSVIDKFVSLAKQLSRGEQNELYGLIDAGLEYGYRLDDGLPNERIELQFPILSKILRSQQ